MERTIRTFVHACYLTRSFLPFSQSLHTKFHHVEYEFTYPLFLVQFRSKSCTSSRCSPVTLQNNASATVR